MSIGIRFIVGSVLWVVAEGFASYYLSKNFFPSQVMARWGKPGIAFFAHGGMWLNLFMLPLLMAWIITRYSNQWSTKQIVTLAMVGFLVTLGNHLLLMFTQKIPDPLGWQKEHWSLLIGMNFVYMTTYVALAGLFFFCSHPSVRATVFVASTLGIYTVFGMHIPLGIMNIRYDWAWCPEFLHTGAFLMQAGIWSALAAISWWTAGFYAGVVVMLMAFCIAAWTACTAFMLCIIPSMAG